MPDFGAALRDESARWGLVPRLVAESPPEWRLGPLTVVVAPGRGGARLRYARQVVGRAGGDARSVMDAWHRASATLARRSLAADVFLPLLSAAYDATVRGAGELAGARVDFVAVREHVCRGRARYSRAQFGWDVARLRRERRLVHDGRRIDLGVATGTATARPSRVVWIEDESGAGQYYLHFRLIAVEPT